MPREWKKCEISSINLGYVHMQAKPKIVLIGCRNVQPLSAYSLLNGPIGIEAVLIGEYAEPLLTSVTELIDGSPLRTESAIRVGEPSEVKDAQICVMSSGALPSVDDTEESFLSRTINIVRERANLLRENAFNGVLVVTTRPAEVMSQVAMEASGLAPEAVIGIGSGSVSNFANAGRSLPLATWCSAGGCDVKFIDSCHPDCPYFESMLERYRVLQGTTEPYQLSTMASCVMRVCEAILGDERTILPVATFLNGQHAIMGTFSNVPCVIGKHGVERVLELPLSDLEKKDLLDAARETGRLIYRLTKRELSVSSGRTS